MPHVIVGRHDKGKEGSSLIAIKRKKSLKIVVERVTADAAEPEPYNAKAMVSDSFRAVGVKRPLQKVQGELLVYCTTAIRSTKLSETQRCRDQGL